MGWDAERVRRVLTHYDKQTDAKAIAEDEAAYRSTTATSMNIPIKLVRTSPSRHATRELTVRSLKRHASDSIASIGMGNSATPVRPVYGLQGATKPEDMAGGSGRFSLIVTR